MFFMVAFGTYGLCKKRWLYGCIRLFLPFYLYDMYHTLGANMNVQAGRTEFLEQVMQGTSGYLYVLILWILFLLLVLYDLYVLIKGRKAHRSSLNKQKSFVHPPYFS